MARLRHIAVCVKNLEQAARFYETVFNLALLKFAGARGNDLADPANAVGANHFGFQVDDLAEAQRRIEAAGGKFFFDLGDARKGNFERKFKDPDGVLFDISQHGWIGTDGLR
jgi:predicted enzyme related to lactoylglutathione lyase